MENRLKFRFENSKIWVSSSRLLKIENFKSTKRLVSDHVLFIEWIKANQQIKNTTNYRSKVLEHKMKKIIYNKSLIN